MGLEKIVEGLSGACQSTKEFLKKEYKFVEASYFFLGTRALDLMTTRYALAEAGPAAEAMPLPRWFMHQYGMGPGLVAHQLLISGAVLAGAYYLNEKKSKKASGNNILYGASVLGLAVGVNNYFESIGISLPVLAVQAVGKLF